MIEKGILTSKEIVLCYKRIAACVLRDRISSFGEILAVDKVSRHLFNLSANGNLNRSKRYSSLLSRFLNVLFLFKKINDEITLVVRVKSPFRSSMLLRLSAG